MSSYKHREEARDLVLQQILRELKFPEPNPEAIMYYCQALRDLNEVELQILDRKEAAREMGVSLVEDPPARPAKGKRK